MQDEHHREENRRPRRIQNRIERRAGKGAADTREVAQALVRALRAIAQVDGDIRAEHGAGEPPFQPGAEADQHHAAQDIEGGHDEKRDRGDQNQDQEGIDASACQNPVEKLQHEQRRRQHQDVYEQAEGADCNEAFAAGVDGRLQA